MATAHAMFFIPLLTGMMTRLSWLEYNSNFPVGCQCLLFIRWAAMLLWVVIGDGKELRRTVMLAAR